MMSREGAGSLPGEKQEPKTKTRSQLFQHGTIKQLFKDLKNVLTRGGRPAPLVRRKRREDTGRLFTKAKSILRRMPQFPAQAYAAATAYLSDTLDWLNLWHQNSDAGSEQCEAAPKDHLYPHL